MTERERTIEQELSRAVEALISKKGQPSEAEVKRYFELVEELPVPDFRDSSEKERERNTEKYKRARQTIRRRVGIE